MARPVVDLVQVRLVAEVDPAGGHEAKRALDLRRELFVAAALGRRRDELLVPHVHLVQISEAALRERADEVQRRSRLVIALQHPLGIGTAGFRSRRVAVDHVPAEGRDLLVPDPFGRGRARLHELAGDAADLDDGEGGAVREHGRHLEHDLQLLPDRDRRELLEGLDAVAGLEQERTTLRDLGERIPERASLAREDERRHRGELRADRLGALRARPVGLLRRRVRAPGGRRPGGARDSH